QWNVAVQHEFENHASVEVTYSGLDGNHLANTLNFNQLGRSYIDRAANDRTVCSLTNNEIIPEGQPGFVSAQRDTCYGAYLRQLVPNPFVGLIREGTLPTPTLQRPLLPVQFPEYSSANRQGYFGSSRYHAHAVR